MTPNTSPIHTLSLHDALPISHEREGSVGQVRRGVGEVRRAREQLAGGIVDRDVPWVAANHDPAEGARVGDGAVAVREDRKSTRLNSSHLVISYAVFCLKKKKK